MQKLIILAALVACGLAGPLENIKESFQITDLPRPSPINPDIPSDPKPEEKVTLIDDADEHTSHQSDAVPQPEKLPGPYVPPSDALSRSKRSDKDSSEEDSSEEDKKSSPPPRPHTLDPLESLKEKHAAKTSTTSAPSSSDSDGATSDASTSSSTTAPTFPRRPYSPLIHQHNEHLFRPTTDSDSSTSTATDAPPAVASKDHNNDKRDIPVPLTRKHHHDDDETKQQEEPDTAQVPKEEVKQDKEKKDEDSKPEPAPHPATIARPIPVADFFAKKPPTTD